MYLPTQSLQNLDPPEWIKFLIGFITGGCASLWGPWDMPYQIVTIVIVCDVIAGIAAGTLTEGFIPSKLVRGVFTKLAYFLAMLLAFQMDQAFLAQGRDVPFSIHEATVWALVVADAISCTANLKIIGVPIPDFLTENIAKISTLANRKPTTAE